MDGCIGALRYFNVYIRDFDYADPSGGLLYFHTGGSLLGARPRLSAGEPVICAWIYVASSLSLFARKQDIIIVN